PLRSGPPAPPNPVRVLPSITPGAACGTAGPHNYLPAKPPARTPCRWHRHSATRPRPPPRRRAARPRTPGTPPTARMLRRYPPFPPRSEEHTSELQSRENLVCRLLLEKKKQKKKKRKLNN